MDVFAAFPTTSYTFLKVSQEVEGNVIEAEYDGFEGILKILEGIVQIDNRESRTAQGIRGTTSLHVKPTESFISLVNGNMVGHGIRASKNAQEDTEYRIIGQVEGYNFDTNELEFYRLTLKRESFAKWETSDLPLE